MNASRSPGLRLFVLLLVLLNGLYFAWSQNLLAGIGFAPAQQNEPQRLHQQIRPEALRLLPQQELRPTETETAASVTAKPAQCLQAGLFDEAQTARLRSALASTLPPGSWTLDAVVEPARWIVYLGKFPSADAMAKKRAELALSNLRFEPLLSPDLQPGLSLGGFETQAAANAALATLSRRGLRNAQVVQERAEVRGSLLRLPGANDALRARLDELKPALQDKVLGPCP